MMIFIFTVPLTKWEDWSGVFLEMERKYAFLLPLFRELLIHIFLEEHGVGEGPCFFRPVTHLWTGASLVVQMVKNLPEIQATWVQSLGQENPSQKGLAIHSSILAGRMSWTEEPGGLQFMGLQRVGHDWMPNTSTFTCELTRTNLDKPLPNLFSLKPVGPVTKLTFFLLSFFTWHFSQKLPKETKEFKILPYWEVRRSENGSVVSNSLWPHGLYSSWNSPGQNTGVGSLSLLQEIFPTQGSNPGLLHWGQILYQLSHKGSQRMLEWAAYPLSRASSQPRN